MKRKLFHLSGAAVLAAGLILAQTPGATPGATQPNAGARHARQGRMWSSLNLTADQKAQARTIFQNARQSAEPVRQQLKDARQALLNAVKNNSPDAEIDRLANNEAPLLAQLSAVHAKAFEKFYALLTPEQRTKLNDMHMGAMLNGGMMGMHAGRMHRQ